MTEQHIEGIAAGVWDPQGGGGGHQLTAVTDVDRATSPEGIDQKRRDKDRQGDLYRAE